MNESINKDLIVVSWNGEEVAQYTIDPNEYKFQGREIKSNNYPMDYSEFANIEDVVMDEQELEIQGFKDRYNHWLYRKKRAFDKKIAQLESEQQRDHVRQVGSQILPNTISEVAVRNIPEPYVGMKIHHKRYGELIITAIDHSRGIIAVRDINGETSHKGWNTLIANNLIEVEG